MTTREYLRARVVRLYRLSLPLIVVILATAIWGRRSVLLSGLVLAVIANYLAAYMVFMRRTPAQCSTQLGFQGAASTALPGRRPLH